MKTTTTCINPSLAALALTLGWAGYASAQLVPVDGGYTATPTTLPPTYEDTGGTELTDGDVGTLVWPDLATDGVPLTGWQNVDATATFNFTAPVNIGRVLAWFADSDGSAGVSVPESIRVTTTGGFDQLFPVTNPVGSGTTVAIVLDGFDITTDNVTLEIARNTALDNPLCCGGAYEWTMLSEVQFFAPGTTVPPALLAPAAVDLGGVIDNPGTANGVLNIGNVAAATSDLTITSVSLSGTDAGSFTLGTSPTSLMPGESGEVTFSFDSGGAVGTYTANIDIVSNDAGSPTSIPVTVEVFAIVPVVPSTPYQQAVVASNPLVYWTFDEAGDTDNAIDLINNVAETELVAQGGATRVPSTVTAGGVSLGRAASFDGGSTTRFDAADLSDDLLPTGSIDQFALEMWFRANDASAQYFMETFSEGGVANQSSLIIGFNGHGLLDEFEIFAGSRTGLTLIDPTEWHHAVVAHYGAGDLEIYIDGVMGTVTGDYNSVQTFGRFALGHTVQATTNGLVGQIDEFAIYDLTGLADDAARRAHVAGIAAHHAVTADPLGFRITEVSREPGNRISLTWTSRPNTSYSIFWSSDLADFGADVTDNVPSAGGTTTHEFDDPSIDFNNPQGLPNVFFRVSEN